MNEETTTLYITRHGETCWNVEGRLQGHLDSELSERGQRQVRALARRLSEFEATALYTSDLGRALATARAIAEICQLSPQKDARLRERHLGVFQGFTAAELRHGQPIEWRQFQKREPNYVIPQGESTVERTGRTLVALREIAERHPGGRVIVVGHGGTLDSIYRASRDLSLAARHTISMANASLNAVAYQGGRWQLVSWGDTNHLELD
jgi:probable phosphoglycerate mutase